MSVSLYFHIPFCKVKCIYCDFYSVVNRDEQIPLFVETLMREFRANPPSPEIYGEVETVYFGGGTPSMLSGSQLASILEAIENVIPIRSDAEITLEANPGEVDLTRLTAYRSAGVNRVSFGLQSFDDNQLKWLGRLHRSNQNPEAVEMARKAGFDNVSVDLIFHLPGQSLNKFTSDLDNMIALNPEHISVYSLTVEQGTPLFQYVRDGRIKMTPDDLDAEMYRHLCRKMSSEKFNHYEVSNFSQPKLESKHNSNYWNGKHYYSYGPSAHSFSGNDRWWNVRDLSKYFNRMQNDYSPIAGREFLDLHKQQEEYLLTRLRTREGVRIGEWEQYFSSEFPDALRNYFRDMEIDHPDWIIKTDDGWHLTEEGWLFNDTIIYNAAENLTTVQEQIR